MNLIQSQGNLPSNLSLDEIIKYRPIDDLLLTAINDLRERLIEQQNEIDAFENIINEVNNTVQETIDKFDEMIYEEADWQDIALFLDAALNDIDSIVNE